MTQRVSAPGTPDIELRNVTACDLPIFYEQQRDPDANQMAAFPPRARDVFMAHWAKILADKTVQARTIVFDGHVAGNIVSWQQDNQRLVGYWIGKRYWGQGVATMALAEYLRLVKTRPLYAHVAKHNVASIRVLEKCGFTTCIEEAESRRAPSDSLRLGYVDARYWCTSRMMLSRSRFI